MVDMKTSLLTVLILLQLDTFYAEWDVRACPKLCRCSLKQSRRFYKNLKTVECSNRKLMRIPTNTPLDTESLILKGNKINDIRGQLQQLKQLVELDLSYNSIQTLGHRPLFENHSSLVYLDLSYNQINVLLHGSFSGASALKYLNLHNNNLYGPEVHAFAGINQLVNLTLYNNKLTGLRREWFQGMRALEVLELDDNQIEVLGKDVFNDLSRLSRLTLERNNISLIQHGSLRSLTSLDYLSLRDNRLEQIPIGSFTTFSNLKFLILDANPVRDVVAGSFEFINVREISLCDMPELEMVDSHAFTNLPFLTIVHMHDNPALSYLDGAAFARVPLLTKLYLHNNNLIALPQKLLDYLPRLDEISYYHNPVRCDCTAHWIRERILLDANKSRALFTHTDRVSCASPPHLERTALSVVPLSALPTKCAPIVMPFFNDTYQRPLGSSVNLNCRAIGVPEPQINWVISNGQVVNASSSYARLKFMLGNLTIYYLRASDGGTYTCIVTNSEGFDSQKTVLRIHSNTMNIIPLGVASNYITVTWNATANTMAKSKYLLMYKKLGSTDKYKGIHLRNYMRTYTIMNLKPKTTYKFCIAYEHLAEVAYINCCNITTQSSDYAMRGITHYSSVAIIIGLVTTVAVVVALCLIFTAVRNYRRRLNYKDPGSSHQGTSRVGNHKVDTMSQIPLDNIYRPPSTPIYNNPSTPIYSSTASLIPNSQA